VFYLFIYLFIYFRQGLSLVLNSRSFCLSLWSAGITGVQHYVWLYISFKCSYIQSILFKMADITNNAEFDKRLTWYVHERDRIDTTHIAHHKSICICIYFSSKSNTLNCECDLGKVWGLVKWFLRWLWQHCDLRA
jgi:hypothetical protein